MYNETNKNEIKEIKEYNLDDINMFFKLPIYYNKYKMPLKKNISTDLELAKTIDSSNNPIYSHIFNTNNDTKNTDINNTDNQENPFTNIIMDQMCEYYTTDTIFLNENQEFLTQYKSINKDTDKNYKNDNDKDKNDKNLNDYNYKDILKIWSEIKGDTGFKEKYQYIDWKMLEFLNHSEHFLQLMSIYNLLSPIVSFCLPFIILVIPFFIIKLKGLDVNLTEYIEILKLLAENHAIGKLFTQFHSVTTNEKMYLIVSTAFYLFTIYQNILVCIRFNHNMIKIHKHLSNIKQYLEHSINKMENYLYYSSKLSSFKDFNEELCDKIKILTSMKYKLINISEYRITNYSKIFEIGHVLKCFYELNDSKIYENAIGYSFGFHGFTTCLDGLIFNIKENKINFCHFIEDNKKIVLKNSYYASLKHLSPIKNTVKFNKNFIVSGPNASGKTTLLKSVLINLILSQQFGCGCYDSAKVKPFKYIHCYLNIPDTSGRDSLFQAEARRCKEIIDNIDANKNDPHFCIFDELYSGTNPEEAVQSAKSLMEYLVKNRNVSCLLTTHFFKLCKKLKKNNNILNCHMETVKTNNKINYSYLLKEGISEIKGGIYVLRDMGYPTEITENTKI